MENNFPETLVEATRYFGDAENCHAFLAEMRWGGTVKCAHCGSEKVGIFSGKRKVSNCKACKRQFTVKVGTIFEDSALGLDKWLPALWMIVNAKNGVSSCELARSLGITQKSAWHMSHRIRLALEQGTFNKLGGIVEVDESYIGGAARFMHKKDKKRRGITGAGANGKSIVMGLLERHSKRSKRPSRIIAEVVPYNDTLLSFSKVKKYVKRGAELHTDAAKHYGAFESEYLHKVVDHAECYVRDNVHTNGLENFWSLLKRTLKGTYTNVPLFIFTVTLVSRFSGSTSGNWMTVADSSWQCPCSPASG